MRASLGPSKIGSSSSTSDPGGHDHRLSLARRRFIYIRGEMTSAGACNKPSMGVRGGAWANAGTGMDLDIILFVGAGAYICGRRRRFWSRSKASVGSHA